MMWIAGIVAIFASSLAEPPNQTPGQAPSQPVSRPAAQPDTIDQAVLVDVMRALPEARSARTDREGLAKAEEVLVARLKALGYEPSFQEVKWSIPARNWKEGQAKEKGKDGAKDGATPPAAPVVSNNIVVEIKGTKLPHEVVLVSAHFDAVPGSPGADDDASGVAGVMELARVLKDRPLERTVRLVLFTFEEVGLVGSAAYVRQWRDDTKPGGPRENETIVAMLSLELLGYYSDKEGSQKSPFPAVKGVFEPSTVGDNIVLVTTSAHQPLTKRVEAAMLAAAPGVKVFRADFSPVPLPDLMRSDHAPFLLAGVPAVMVTDTANFRNPNYHKATDTIETLDLERMTRTVEGIAGAVRELAGGR
ncbi:MAG: M20/M25/M40 family metallo-hydrolase [Phycisphaerales bacterium]|jgi:Zn-dependent M28 family amino/carboxypeptidase|nr:M20/M25/M40 family metallo-hydrolase [Phycisphaerales bacterium]